MARDNAPIKNTCPVIDDVINYIDKFQAAFENDDNRADFICAFSCMEDLRTANQTLRDWGNEEYQRAEDLEKKVDELSREISNLKADVEYYKDECKQLSELIKELESTHL